VNKILIIGPSWVGDMVMAQTLLKTIQHQAPDSQLDIIAPSWTLPLVERMPEVHQGIALPFGHGDFQLRQRYRFGQRLIAAGYDQAIVLPNSWKSAVIPWAAKIPKRTGWLGEQRWGLLNDIHHLDKRQYPLMIQRFMALAGQPMAGLSDAVPKPSLSITPIAVQQALAAHGLVLDKPILGLCPGAEFGDSKRWPADYFADVANAKRAEGWDIWLFGSSKDAEIAEHIQQKTQGACQNLVGKTRLSEAIDLMSLVSAVVSNDSGLMHIAAALDLPQVIPYGSTSPQFTPPLSDKAKILSLSLACAPCFKRACPLQHHRCMRDLLPSMVLNALQEMPS
jgi:heptosyltransferase II